MKVKQAKAVLFCELAILGGVLLLALSAIYQNIWITALGTLVGGVAGFLKYQVTRSSLHEAKQDFMVRQFQFMTADQRKARAERDLQKTLDKANALNQPVIMARQFNDAVINRVANEINSMCNSWNLRIIAFGYNEQDETINIGVDRDPTPEEWGALMTHAAANQTALVIWPPESVKKVQPTASGDSPEARARASSLCKR